MTAVLFWSALAVALVAPSLAARRARIRPAAVLAFTPGGVAGIAFGVVMWTHWGHTAPPGEDIERAGTLFMCALALLGDGVLGLIVATVFHVVLRRNTPHEAGS
jgi:hypothetical protein